MKENSTTIYLIAGIVLAAMLVFVLLYEKLFRNKREVLTLETRDFIIYYSYATFSARFLARLIDFLIIVLPSSIIPIIPAWLYWSLQESGKERTTVGKKSLDLYVMTTDGKRISFGKASLRFLGMLFNVGTFFIGIIIMFFNKKNQCLHDLLTNTIVVKEIKRVKKQADTQFTT